MSGWVDEKYAMMLQPRLEGFTLKRRNPLLINCRCPLCGDSKKDRRKKRGYLYAKGGAVFYSCKNCGEGKTIKGMLWTLDRRLYDEYVVENFVQPARPTVPDESTPAAQPSSEIFAPEAQYDGLERADLLPEEHPALEYLGRRRVPPEVLGRLYWCPAYYAWVNTRIPGKFSPGALKMDKGRIVFPFVGRDLVMFGCSGRAIDDDSLRYVSVKFDEDRVKVFGAERVDWGRDVYAFEGQIDSLFVPNSIAVAGGDVFNCGLPKDRAVLCWDNEPRNPEVVKMVGRAIADGWRVFLWPENWWTMGKDINDLVMAGVHCRDVVRIIKECSYSGMMAQLKFDNWKKTKV
jgi:hypothetical protein